MQSLKEIETCAANRLVLTILPKAKAVGQQQQDLAFVYPGDAEYRDGGRPSDSRLRHRTYAEAIYKNGKATKPKQPLTVRGIVRTGIENLPDMRIGEIPDGEEVDRAKL